LSLGGFERLRYGITTEMRVDFIIIAVITPDFT
jgi:hypothetical protein